jgi:hypothetical protein
VHSDALEPDAETAPGLQGAGPEEQPATVSRPAHMTAARSRAAGLRGQGADRGRVIAHEVSAAHGSYGSQPSELTIVDWPLA